MIALWFARLFARLGGACDRAANRLYRAYYRREALLAEREHVRRLAIEAARKAHESQLVTETIDELIAETKR